MSLDQRDLLVVSSSASGSTGRRGESQNDTDYLFGLALWLGRSSHESHSSIASVCTEYSKTKSAILVIRAVMQQAAGSRQ